MGCCDCACSGRFDVIYASRKEEVRYRTSGNVIVLMLSADVYPDGMTSVNNVPSLGFGKDGNRWEPADWNGRCYRLWRY